MEMAEIGMHMENILLWIRKIDSTTIVKIVSATETENEVIILGRPELVLRKAVSAMSANQMELTTLDKR